MTAPDVTSLRESADDRCLSCGDPIDRTVPAPIPEDYECMATEALSGRAEYCRACFDKTEVAE